MGVHVKDLLAQSPNCCDKKKSRLKIGLQLQVKLYHLNVGSRLCNPVASGRELVLNYSGFRKPCAFFLGAAPFWRRRENQCCIMNKDTVS